MARQTLDFSPALSPLDAEGRAIETLAQPAPPPSLSEQIGQYLKSDPDGFCQVHCRANPRATFQAIALKRLEGESWQQISNHFGLKISALSNFFQRNLKKISPKIREFIQGASD